VVWLFLFRNVSYEQVPIRKAKIHFTNILRRIKYEYNEERYLMAADIDLKKIVECGDIKITYGSISPNRLKLDYWRNVDGIRFQNKESLTSKNYHSYCADPINCAVCTLNDNFPEIYFFTRSLSITTAQKHELYNEFWDSIPQEHKNTIYLYRYYEYSTWLTVTGEEWLFLKNAKLAREWINKEIEFDPNASSYWARGETYEMENDFDNAIKDYQMAWEYDPAYTYKIAKARAYMKTGQSEKAASEYCLAICDINDRCEKNIMNYMRTFKYELIKSRLLACPPYLKTSEVQSLDDISKLLERNRQALPEKEYLSCMSHLFWAIERDCHNQRNQSNNNLNESKNDMQNVTTPQIRNWRFSPLVK
jgi:tetratricopeptide (TPR) repeat protein